MLENSGTFIFLIALIASVGLLVIFTILIGILGKKRNKSGGLTVLKSFSLLFAIVSMGLSIAMPFAYYNYMPVNLRYGTFSAMNSNGSIEIHRDSFTIRISEGNQKFHGTWTLENNYLKLSYNGSVDQYEVKDFGTKLYKSGELVYKYNKY